MRTLQTVVAAALHSNLCRESTMSTLKAAAGSTGARQSSRWGLVQMEDGAAKPALGNVFMAVKANVLGLCDTIDRSDFRSMLRMTTDAVGRINFCQTCSIAWIPELGDRVRIKWLSPVVAVAFDTRFL